MSIELIISFVLWFVLTEVIFFGGTRYSFDFFEAKLLAMFGSFVLSLFLFGLPALIAAGTGLENVEDAVGNIFYVWYYGIISVIALFFGVNYLIYKKGEKNE